jgi:DNA-directed RNA polymerase subunit D
MKIINETPEKLVIRSGIEYSLANAIRRCADEIHILAVDEVEIFKNDSALYDEFLAHRIGLVPLKTDDKMSDKTSIDLKLSTSGECTVYSGDMKGGAKVVFDKIPLTLLKKGQELELVATAKLGKGVDHAKYSPGIIYYKHLLEIKSKNSDVQKIVENSKGLVKIEKKGDVWLCDLNESETDEVLKNDPDSIKDSDEILITIESFGQLSNKDLLSKAISSLECNLDEFEKALK